jgi:hypothetical protein
MKAPVAMVVAALTLAGCVVTDPYYQPVYAQPAPVYVQPRPVYVAPPPSRCAWVQRWNGYNRRYENVRVCR